MARTAQATVKRVLLGREIAHCRKLANMSLVALGAAIGKGADVLNRLEDGRATIKADELEALLDALDIADPEHRSIVRDMHADSHRTEGWNTGYRRIYAEDLRLLIDLEQNAEHIFMSQVEIIPGILQTRDYTRSLINQNASMEHGVDETLEAWQARQGIFSKPNAPMVHIIMSESALRRRYAEPAVMKRQLEYIDALTERHRNILLQVLPFDGGEKYFHAPRSFQILRVASNGLAGHLRMVYDEGLQELRYRGDSKVLALHDDVRASLTAAAMNADDSRRMIRDIASRFAAASESDIRV